MHSPWQCTTSLSSGLVPFTQDVESAYQAGNPYHNNVHAADVVQSLAALLELDDFKAKLTNLEVAAMLLSAVVHDVGHPGTSAGARSIVATCSVACRIGQGCRRAGPSTTTTGCNRVAWGPALRLRQRMAGLGGLRLRCRPTSMSLSESTSALRGCACIKRINDIRLMSYMSCL